MKWGVFCLKMKMSCFFVPNKLVFITRQTKVIGLTAMTMTHETMHFSWKFSPRLLWPVPKREI